MTVIVTGFDIDRRVVRDVQVVCEQELQAVAARRERHRRLGLSLAEVHVVRVGRDRQVERRRVGVDQQVMVAGVLHRDAGGRDAHAAQAEAHGHGARDRLAIVRRDDVELDVLRRGTARQVGSGRDTVRRQGDEREKHCEMFRVHGRRLCTKVQAGRHFARVTVWGDNASKRPSFPAAC